MELKDMLEMVAAGLAVVMAVFGLAIMFRQIAKAGLGPYNLQGLGLVLLVPTILILALTGGVRGDVVATLLGGVAGYIFGRGDERSK